MSSRVPREKAVFCEALEITDPAQRRQFARVLLREASELVQTKRGAEQAGDSLNHKAL